MDQERLEVATQRLPKRSTAFLLNERILRSQVLGLLILLIILCTIFYFKLYPLCYN